MVKILKLEKKDKKRYLVRKAGIDFNVIEKVDDEDRKIATFYGHEAFKVSSSKPAPQRMAEKVAREMNCAWDQIKHLFKGAPKQGDEG